MKKKFSRMWKKSRNPRKQRKYRANAMLHIKRKMVSALLDKDLRKKYMKRSLPIRKGDVVIVMRGINKGKKGKVSEVNLKKLKIKIEGIETKKVSGESTQIFIDPSNVMITVPNMEDIKRKRFVKRIDKLKKDGNKNKKKGEKV